MLSSEDAAGQACAGGLGLLATDDGHHVRSGLVIISLRVWSCGELLGGRLETDCVVKTGDTEVDGDG